MPLRYRPVTIVNAAARKQLKLRIEVPVEDMARLGEMEEIPIGPASQTPRRVSIWNAIHPRLLEIIRERNSTILFVNARQIAERLAGALNDLAGEPIARAHHGSLAAAQRSVIEEQLKAGQIKALCATSTLELGIDMGAVDLVIQIESPPSVASGMQRIGRAGHHVDAVSEGILFPKYRADLVACAAVTRAMHEGHIESTRFPRNPLDVLCQQLVAIVAIRTKDRDQGTKGPRDQSGRDQGIEIRDQTPPRASSTEEAAQCSDHADSASAADSAAPEVSVDYLLRPRPRRRAVWLAFARGLRWRARSAQRPLPLRRVWRAAPAAHVGSRAQRRNGARRRGAAGDPERRNHSRSRALRRLSRVHRGQISARGRARRGDGLRVAPQ